MRERNVSVCCGTPIRNQLLYYVTLSRAWLRGLRPYVELSFLLVRRQEEISKTFHATLFLFRNLPFFSVRRTPTLARSKLICAKVLQLLRNEHEFSSTTKLVTNYNERSKVNRDRIIGETIDRIFISKPRSCSPTTVPTRINLQPSKLQFLKPEQPVCILHINSKYCKPSNSSHELDSI